MQYSRSCLVGNCKIVFKYQKRTIKRVKLEIDSETVKATIIADTIIGRPRNRKREHYFKIEITDPSKKKLTLSGVVREDFPVDFASLTVKPL